MPFNEVFPNPVVKQVAFEIRFPNLFFLEQKIGDFQIKIMRRFPESELLFQRNVLIAQGISADDLKDAFAGEEEPEERVMKIWKFTSPGGMSLQLTTNRLWFTSDSHKSYRLGSDTLRDAIKAVLDPFLELTAVPLFLRVGMRYIDDCPVPMGGTAAFRSYYNTALPLDRFPLEDTSQALVNVVAKVGSCSIRFIEAIMNPVSEERALRIDIDAWKEKVDAPKYLEAADELHDAIGTVFEKSIKQPVIDFMKTPKGNENAA